MSIEEVRALVAERQRYDDWLAALEAKRAETPPRVFERVHGDYLGRRGDVITRLQAHVGSLATLGDELEQRLAELEAQLGAHEDELAEGMLRNLVGEYDGDRWDAVRQDIEAKIATLNEQRSALLAECDDVRTLLASARVMPDAAADEVQASDASEASYAEPVHAEREEPEAAEAAEASEAPEAFEAPAVEAEGMTAAPEETPVVVAALDEGLVADDTWDAVIVDTTITEAVEVDTFELPAEFAGEATPEAAFAQDAVVVGNDLLDIDVSAMMNGPAGSAQTHEEVLADVAALFDTASITAVPAPDAMGTVAAAPSATQDFDDALAMFGESSGDADPQFVQSLQGIEADHNAAPSVTPPLVPSGTASAPPAANDADPFDDLAFLRSVIDPGGAAADVPPPAPSPSAAMAGQGSGTAAHEPLKTLRCTECGTMNLPTEWYCERCGGELAAF